MKYFVHISKQFILSLATMLLFSFSVSAQEITAIDFNGDIIGKVIPNGSVVSNDNLLIGKVSPDSLIVDFDGKIIGGVVPQGIAVGNDFNVLGKINADGTVRVSSGKIVGKVLPAGHVVNERFDIIGGVVFPGLVYNDAGDTIGRLTGDGIYANNQGKKVGFISADGYAYRQIGAEKVLDGKLLSSKMVVSMAGDFIGSIVPGGVVSDFASKPIGRVRANGFVYNEKSEAIGKAVSSGYVFDFSGSYIGFVTYNGKVVNQGQTIGVLKANGQVVNNNNDVIGWRVDFSATATDLEGKYLGRLIPNGDVVRERNVIGSLGARGKVFDNQGQMIGQLSYSGPVFDYNANLIGHNASSGGVYSFDGALLGYSKDRFVYDFSNNIIGATQSSKAVYDNANKFLGISGVSPSVQKDRNIYKVSPFGYVFDQNQNVYGKSFNFDMVYSQNGQNIGSLDINGSVLDKGYKQIGQINVHGFVTGVQDKLIGKILPFSQVVPFDNKNTYVVANNNLVLDIAKSIKGKILADGSVAATDDQKSTNLLPVIAFASSDTMAIGYDGEFIGSILSDNSVVGQSGVTGYLTFNDVILNEGKEAVAQGLNVSVAVNDKCKTLGVLANDGNVLNSKNVNVGKALANGQIVSSRGAVMGHLVKPTAYIDYAGNIVAYSNVKGEAVAPSGQIKGCVDSRGNLYAKSGQHLASSLSYVPVIGFNNDIIGRVVFDGKVYNKQEDQIGYLQANGNVNDKSGNVLGSALKYRYAFSADNQYVGIINPQGDVVDTSQNKIGSVTWQGQVKFVSGKNGYALYDMYIYDAQNNAIGYITPNGSVLDFNNKTLGKIRKGFYVDNEGNVLGRGYRDFYVRNSNKSVIGYLQMDGSVIAENGAEVGKINEQGSIVSSAGKIIGQANSLQFYSVLSENFSANDWDKRIAYDSNGKIIGYVDANGNVLDINGKELGKTLADGSIVDANGNKIGYTTNEPVSLAYDENGVLRGFVDSHGNVIDASTGQMIGKSEGGFVVDGAGKTIGQVGTAATIAYDEKGNIIGYVNKNNEVVGADGKIIGYLDEHGRVIDDNGQIIGSSGTHMKAAYDKDGNVIGFVDAFGNVKDFQGNVIGKEQNGNIIDATGNEIGVIGEYKPIVYDDFGNVIGYVDENNNVIDTQGNIIGSIDENNNMIDASGKVKGTVGRKMRVVQDKNGNTIGFADFMGRFFNHAGEQTGKVVGSKIVDVNGNSIGSVGQSRRPIYDVEGNLIGYSAEDDFVVDINGKIIGTIKSDGTVIDANNNIIGGIGENWYKREAKKTNKKTSSSVAGRDIESWVTGSDYVKSFNIALNNKGDFLGNVLVDGTVIDEKGNVVGNVTADGFVKDRQGNLIGVVDSSSQPQEKSFYYDKSSGTYVTTGSKEEKPAINTSGGVFFPSFGAGGAYGTGTGAQNLGSGGGYGAGERYDPNRVAALQAAHQERRNSITISHTKSGYKKTAAFDGYQKDWGEAKAISTWRVDMSQMILQDKPIPAVIARAINSGSDAPVTAFVERNVYAEEGRNVLIPAGSRLIGELGGMTASTEATSESAKVTIAWKRLIRPDGSAFKFDGKTGDAQGRGGGALGYVDKQLFKKYFSPLMYTSLTTATTYLLKDRDKGTSGDGESTGSTAAEDARENFMSDMDRIFSDILDDKLNIQAITYVPAGTRIVVYPGQDLWLVNEDLDEEVQAKQESNGKPKELIDDSRTGANNASGGSSGTTGTTGQVVYSAGDGNQAQPQSTPLIADKSNKTQPKVRPITPPPPSFSVNTSTVPAAQNKQEDTNASQDDSVPALF